MSKEFQKIQRYEGCYKILMNKLCFSAKLLKKSKNIASQLNRRISVAKPSCYEHPYEHD